jgi:hypothetical protein
LRRLQAMDDLLARVWDHLVGRTAGPLRFRLVLQPIVAVSLAIGAGLRDAALNRPPFLWITCVDAAQRAAMLRDAWKDVRRLFILACIADAVYQVLVFRWVYPVQALVVAGLVAVVPYIALRGPINRLVRVVKRR